jgi:hypothetical protein
MNSVINIKRVIRRLSGLTVIMALIGFGSTAGAALIVIDNTDSTNISVTGTWTSSSSVSGYVGSSYSHDGNSDKGNKSFEYLIGAHDDFFSGMWLIEMNWTEHANRANNVPVDIETSGGTFSVDQTVPDGGWYSLGVFDLNTNSLTRIRTTDTNGYVIADAFRFTSVPEPSILALFGAGIIGLGLVRRRKLNQS